MIPHSNHLSGLFDCIIWVQGGGGGTVLFFFIHRLGLSIYCLLSKIIRNIKNPPTPPPPPPPKKNWNFTNPKNIPNSVPWPLETTLKCIEMTPFVMTPKISTKSSYPKKCSFSEIKKPKILKFKILNQKNSPRLRMYKNYRVPPPRPGVWYLLKLWIASQN